MNISLKNAPLICGIAASVVSSNIATSSQDILIGNISSNKVISNDCETIFSNIKAKTDVDIIKSQRFPESDIEQWTSKHEKRFSELLILIHSRSANKLERAEYKRLRSVRSELRSSRTSDEILADIKRNQLVDSVIASLEQYVEFIGKSKKR